MKILVCGARNPFALDMVRKLASEGHTVHSSETFSSAAAGHSRYLAGRLVTASPRHQTERFIDDTITYVTDHDIELVIPTFEEAFYLAAHRARIERVARLYTGQFRQLASLHDKVSLQRMAEAADVRIPQTRVAHDDASLREAIGAFPQYFARAAFSRGGVSLLTNSGPLAGTVDVADCHPTAESPWLVQEFVTGPMVCTYSTVHEGRVTTHCAYRAPHQWEHSTGISFLGIDGRPTLEIVRELAEPMRYTGQLSFDFVDRDGELFLIECNPRSTDGVLLVSPAHLSTGLTNPDAPLSIVPAGTEVQLDFAVIAELFREPLRQAPHTIHDLLTVHDAGRGWHDHLPMLWSFASMAKGAASSRHQHTAVLAAMAEDVVWNGEPIAGMNAGDTAQLAELTANRTHL